MNPLPVTNTNRKCTHICSNEKRLFSNCVCGCVCVLAKWIPGADVCWMPIPLPSLLRSHVHGRVRGSRSGGLTEVAIVPPIYQHSSDYIRRNSIIPGQDLTPFKKNQRRYWLFLSWENALGIFYCLFRFVSFGRPFLFTSLWNPIAL